MYPRFHPPYTSLFTMKKTQTTGQRALCELEFGSQLGAPAFRRRLADLLERDATLSNCFIPEDNLHFYRIWGFEQVGQVAVTHCDFGGSIGIRINFRYRRGDRGLFQHLITKLGKALLPLGRTVSGRFPRSNQRPDRMVAHILQNLIKPAAAKGVVIVETAIESALDWRFDDEAEVAKQLHLISAVNEERRHTLIWDEESLRRVIQLGQTYPNHKTCLYQGRRVRLDLQCHIPSEDGDSVLRLYFGLDKPSAKIVIGWVDQYNMTP